MEKYGSLMSISSIENILGQGSSTFYSPRTPWLRERLGTDPHPKCSSLLIGLCILYLDCQVIHLYAGSGLSRYTPVKGVLYNSFKFILFHY